MKILELIDLAKETSGSSSDRELAKKLGWSHTTLHHWRSGRSQPSEEHAHDLATFAGVDPAPYVLDAIARRTKNAGLRSTLKRLSAALGLLLLPFLTLSTKGVYMCILCKIVTGRNTGRLRTIPA